MAAASSAASADAHDWAVIFEEGLPMREDGTFVISPGKAEAFRFEKGDRVVVLADHL